jgi:hypothetical protein
MHSKPSPGTGCLLHCQHACQLDYWFHSCVIDLCAVTRYLLLLLLPQAIKKPA